MNKVSLVSAVTLLLVACAVGLNLQATTLIAERTTTPLSRWQIVGDAQPDEWISFKILLKQSNLEKLDAIFWEVSNPQHANYGKYLTQQELRDLTAADKEAVKSVLQWLIAAGIPKEDIQAFSDYITVVTPVEKASALFNADFAVYKSQKTDKIRTRINGAAYIPTELKQHIDFVTGISELMDDTRIAPKENRHKADPNLITPAVLKSYYGITGTATNANTTQGIAAFSDYFSQGALAAFDQHFGITGVNVVPSGPDCLNETTCDQYESDLDVQYVTALGLGAATQFLAHGGSEWILDFALQMKTAPNPPLIASISYGWAELEQCEITIGCQTYGYTSQQYVDRTDTELQGLGALGITVLVSDGDDGAPSLGGATGNCPIDPSKYCPLGGCAHSSTKCAGITFTIASNGTACYFPMGVGSETCAGILSLSSVNPVLNKFAEANPKCGFALDQDAKQNYHIYSSCECSQLKEAEVSGLKLSGYVFDQNAGAVFAADYPTSSPYVTSVGATQFTWNGNNVASEIGASITTGAIITTGGGFSSFQGQPSYQTAAVQAYLSSGAALPPSFSFNPKMRAYPDVAFNGHNYLIFASNNSDLNTCPCTSFPVDGTSCSSPAFAGFLSLINDQLLNAGKSSLGFLNPLLYQLANTNPDAFNDITSGSNECNRAYCCQYGYTATTGWDPVSGLGSPIFSKFSSLIKQAKGAN